jgi:predicted Zn-dependent protease
VTRCGECVEEGHAARSPLEAAVVAASSAEARAALGAAWPFVAMDALTSYAEGLSRDLAGRFAAPPAPIRVHVVREPAFRAIFLAPGDLVLSTGLLGDLVDEAELAFVMGHELCHGFRHDAAEEVSRVALRALARHPEHHGPEMWVQSVLDVARLGYGRTRENEADLAAVEAMRDMGYDVAAALRLLARVERMSQCGAPEVAEWALSHPTATERQRQLESALREAGEHVGVSARVNREPFRRAVAALRSGGDLPAARPFSEPHSMPVRSPVPPARRWILPLAVAASGLLAAAVWWLLR